MKTKTTLIALAMGFFLLLPLALGASGTMENALPQLKGWEKKGETKIYTPDNLYEYINGAADAFLAYDFQRLASTSFENKKKLSFTVDVYFHGNIDNGFGIYCQEKPQQGPFLDIGTQGYYEQGVLNFLKGGYYVKLSGYDLGDIDKKVLTEAARQVEKKLAGENRFPKAVESFPKKGMVKDSERFISKNFLGHSFLHSAFVADYDSDGRTFQVFIIQTDDANSTKKILESYLTFVKGKGKTVETPGKGFYRFQDPYYRSKGAMNMKHLGKYLVGLFSKNPQQAALLIEEVEKKLPQTK